MGQYINRDKQYWEAMTATDCYYMDGIRKRRSVRRDGTGKSITFSRYVWIMANGDPGDDIWVLHTCPNGVHGCVTLAHLYTGTQKDNVRDQFERDKTRGPGERAPVSKLTDQKILEIRARSASGETHVAISKDYGVTAACICSIVKRRSWKHI
jgi:hypothetical protein